MLVIPNTVDEVFTPGDGAAIRAALRLEGKRVLLTVGRMESRERYKGHELVIGTIPELVARGHDVTYIVIGEGDARSRLEVLALDTSSPEPGRFLRAGGLGRFLMGS